MHKPLLIACGFVALILGIIGAFLPVLPTTPFAILAAYCFSKSSPRLHRWILSLPVLGPNVEEWEKHKVIRPWAKFACVVLIIITIASSIIFGNLRLYLQIILIGIGLSVVAFVVTRKSYPDK